MTRTWFAGGAVGVLRRSFAAAATIVAMTLVLVTAAAGPAAAHAELLRSDPASSAHLDAAPASVVLEFSERIGIVGSPVEVRDAGGRSIPLGTPQAEGRTVRVAVPPLTDGAYVVSWRALSADTHPVAGSYTFTIGAASVPAPVLDEPGADAVVTVLGWLARAVAATTALVAAGLVLVFVVFGRRSTAGAPVPYEAAAAVVRRVMTASAVALVAAVVIGLAVQASLQHGGAAADLVSGGAWGDVLGTRFGNAWLARGALAVLLVPLGRRIVGGGAGPVVRGIGVALVVGLGATFVLAGHASSGRWPVVAVLADAAHLAGGALWIGGLVALACLASASRDDVRAAARGFAPVALASAAVLACSGVAQAVRLHVVDVAALVDDDYGRLLVAKVVLVALVVAIASRSRRWTRTAGTLPQHLRRLVLAELVLLAAVLGVTAALVRAEPPHPAPATSDGTDGEDAPTFVDTRTVEGVTVELRVGPTVPGTTTMQVRAVGGRVVDELTLRATPPGSADGAIRLATHEMGDGVVMASHVTVPFPGDWVIVATARLGEFEQVDVRFVVPFG